MKTRREFLATVGVGIASASIAGTFSEFQEDRSPALEFAFSATISLGDVQEMGQTPHGNRRVIPIAGGIFKGPLINGIVEPGGADWQIVRDDKVAELDAQYTLRTDDNVLIYIRNRGYRHGPADVLARIANGEAVNPKEYYFRTSAIFETSSKKYDYLNKFIYIGVAERKKDGVLISFYKVL